MEARTPVILMRTTAHEQEEYAIAARHLPVYESRMDVPDGSLVVGRYSVLPYYEELDRDLGRRGSRLINLPQEHRFLADVTAWSDLLEGMTPRTWTHWARLPQGAYVVKGRTNSRKHRWSTHMFAPTREDIPAIVARLMDDALLSEQGLVVREYLPLLKLGEGINGLPITNEWRTFWLRQEGTPRLLARGFYWAASHPELAPKAAWTAEAEALARQAARIVSASAAFFVLDLAQRSDGRWTVIELNDGQMSGLCGCHAETLYAALASTDGTHPPGSGADAPSA